MNDVESHLWSVDMMLFDGSSITSY